MSSFGSMLSLVVILAAVLIGWRWSDRRRWGG
jgi:hypothetical protein